MTTDFSKIGKLNKKKGYYGERKSATFWMKELGGEIRPTPRSGAFWDLAGDLLARDNIIQKDNWVVDVKFGINAVPKKIKKQMEKLKDDASGKKYWLELSDPNGETYVVINRKIFAKLLFEIQEWRKEK